MKQSCSLSKLPQSKCLEILNDTHYNSKSSEKNKKSFAFSEKSNNLNERFDKKSEINASKLLQKQRTSSSIFSEWDYSFHPEINSKSRKLSGERLKNTIYEKLYKQGMAIKRCKSFKTRAVKGNNFQKLGVDHDRIYKSGLIYKAESRKKNLLLRRNQSISEGKELKFSPNTCKFNFAVPRKQKKIEDLLILSELQKRASRFKLVRKFQYK